MKIARKLIFVVAGDTLATVEKKWGKAVWRTLADNGFVDRKSVCCVGFHRDLEVNDLIVVLPKAFNSDWAKENLNNPNYRRDQIFRLIRVFKKVRRETSLTLEIGRSNRLLSRESHLDDPVLDSFDAALRLRQDYREKGLYFRKSSRSSLNTSALPMNWPITLRSSTILLCGSNVLMSDTVHHSRKRNLSDPLSLLHIACLKEVFHLVGERNELDSIQLLSGKNFNEIKSKSQHFLRQCRVTTFDERGIFLIGAMSAFLGESSLLSSSHEKKEELLSYSKDFEDIWERVLRDLMAPDLVTRSLPVGCWYSWPDGVVRRGVQPEFDIRLNTGELDVLVDAKDYRLLNGSKWLGSSGDHYKQIIYRQLIDESANKGIINILAFPSLGQKELFHIRGCHCWNEIPSSCVFEITVDYDLAIKYWLREVALDVKKEIDNLLKKLQKFNSIVLSTDSQ